MREINKYIKQEYNKPFYRSGGCLCKSLRIVKMARRLDHSARLAVCISFPKHSAFFGLPGCFIHYYCLVDGKKVDVAFDPGTEKKRMKNEEVKMTRGVTIPFI